MRLYRTLCVYVRITGLNASTTLHRLVHVEDFPHGFITAHEIGNIKVLIISLKNLASEIVRAADR